MANIFKNQGLYSYKWKRFSIVMSFIVTALVVLLKIYGDDNSAESFLLLILLVFLLTIAFSKEKVDDERIRAIRYFSLKQSFLISMMATGLLTYSFKVQFEHVYYGIGSVLLYIILFAYFKKAEPAFIFKEKTRKTTTGDYLGIAIAFIGLIVICVYIITKMF